MNRPEKRQRHTELRNSAILAWLGNRIVRLTRKVDRLVSEHRDADAARVNASGLALARRHQAFLPSESLKLIQPPVIQGVAA